MSPRTGADGASTASGSSKSVFTVREREAAELQEVGEGKLTSGT